MPYFSHEVIQPYIDARLISERSHPDAPHLKILNYTNHATYEGVWDEITTQCRGLILDRKEEKVVAACLKKAFNLEEHVAKGWPIPDEVPIVTTKFDGWYASLYWLNDEPWIATRGSFTSPGAIWATAWIREWMVGITEDARAFYQAPEWTHIFEIISPITRIVVKYDFEGLVQLATLDTVTGEDRFPYPVSWGMRCVEGIAHDNYQALTQQSAENAEGFVCLFPTSGVRIKLKYAQYMALHQIYTQLSAHKIWEMLRDGEDVSALFRSFPDELRGWALAKANEINETFLDTYEDIKNVHQWIMRHELTRSWKKDKTARDKEIALAIQKHPEIQGLLFAYHKYREAIWKTLEPSGLETFRQEGNE